MRSLVLALFVFAACDGPGDKGEKSGKSTPPIKAVENEGESGGAAATTGGGPPAPDPVVVDDDNRFVQEDLDRFMKANPDVLRASDTELFATCRGERCLEHGASETLGPFKGAGVRYLVPLWLRGCLTGSAEACLLSGRTYQGSRLDRDEGNAIHEGLTPDDLAAKFRQYIDRACRLSDAHCEQWADYMLGDDAPAAEDVKRAIAKLREGCTKRAAGSCASLARNATKYVAIGDARGWWRQACEHAGPKSGKYCADYGALLLATGAAADRTLAAAALDRICDPAGKTWAARCTGDATLGLESCESVFMATQGFACVHLAATLPAERALRLTSAMCVGSLLTEANAAGRKACDEASRLAGVLKQSPEFNENLRRRTCEVSYMECLDATFDIDACSKTKNACTQPR